MILQPKNSGACDVDGNDLKIRPVKYVHSLVAVPTHIFNVSLVTDVFPKQMQIAKRYSTTQK